MIYLETINGIKSSVLGFGCSTVMGSSNSEVSRRAIDCALDHGITHFDLARSYGYGAAEKFIGECLRNKREQVVLASKFGIQANWKAKAIRPIMPILRKAVELKKKENNQVGHLSAEKVNHSTDLFHSRININVENMKTSLENSLKALKTDYLDYYFIHEPLTKIHEIDAVVNLANNLKKEGKIRAFGLAFYQDQLSLHSDYIKQLDILQFNHAADQYTDQVFVQNQAHKPNVIFSPLKGGNQNLDPLEKLKQVHLDFPQSIILCSMMKESHIIKNTSIFENEINSIKH